MKTLVAFALALVAAAAVVAAPVLLVGSLQTVNNTTFTSNTNILSANFPTPQQLSVTHSGLASTNDVVVKYQVSVDNVNWATFATTGMPTTNAVTEVMQGYNYPVTNYFRVQIVTTNSQQVGVSYGN
ncbi:MAG: hypothetical protein ABFD89_06610 [Bryobacteraceae bacterium]